MCGKCFELLPLHEQGKCVKQVGLEAVAALIKFPCRFYKSGCQQTFALNEPTNHEESCPYNQHLHCDRSKEVTYDQVHQNNNSYQNVEYTVTYGNVISDLNFRLRENHLRSSFNLKFNMNLKGTNGYRLLLQKNNEVRAGNMEMELNGAILFKECPQVVFTDMKMKPIKENIYETIKPAKIQCANCQKTLKDEIHHCLFGHMTCYNCKGAMCVVCSVQMNSDMKRKCKNFSVGCNEIPPLSELRNHEDNCIFNNRICPFEGCSFSNVFNEMKIHLEKSHPDDAFADNQILKRCNTADDSFALLCYSTIFKCSYYYFEDYVEFVVIHFGSTTETDNYTCEILLVENDLMKRGICADWNNFMLSKSIKFSADEINRTNEYISSFDISLKIIRR